MNTIENIYTLNEQYRINQTTNEPLYFPIEHLHEQITCIALGERQLCSSVSSVKFQRSRIHTT